ncbi:MAG: hypothetical protein ABI903_01300 [Actinomycetota bacterium]
MSQSTDTASTVLAENPAGREVFGEPLRRLLAVSFAFLLISVAVVGMAAHRAPQLSVLDEATHADYAYEIWQGHVPAKGSTIAPEILKQWSCHGTFNGSPVPPCENGGGAAASYPGNGENYNFSHPPLYYAITGVIAGLADAALPGNSHFITLARMVGSLWLFAGMLVFYLAVRRFGASWQLSAGGAILLLLTPQAIGASTAVSNDAPAAVSGALAVLMLARILGQRKYGWIIPALVTGFAASTKILNALPMLSLAGVLVVVTIVAWRDERREEARKLALIVIAVLAATVAVWGGWMLFQSGRGLPGWKSPIAGFSDRPVAGTPVGEIFGELFTGLQLFNGYYLPPQLKSTWFGLWIRVLAFLGAAAPVILIAVTKKRDVERWLAGTALIGMISYPILVELQVYSTSGRASYFPYVTPRYGMSMIPVLLACLVMIAHRRQLNRSMLAGVVTGAAVSLAAVSGLLNT